MFRAPPLVDDPGGHRTGRVGSLSGMQNGRVDSSVTVRSGGRALMSQSAAGLGYFSFEGFGMELEGSEGVSAVRMTAYVRRPTAKRPYGVVNDYIASALGMAVGLPVPPGTLMQTRSEFAYISLGFSDRGDRLPPALLDEFAEERPWEATGVLAFDQWIYNSDRHSGNLAFDSKLGVSVYDHDLSLIARANERPVDTLREYRDKELSGHPLAKYVKNASYFESWFDRIAGIRTEEVRRIVRTCSKLGLIENELKQELINFVDFRKAKVKEYIERTRNEYSEIATWPFVMAEASDAG